MQDKILVGNAKFWIDQDILHCKFYNENNDIDFIKENIDTYLRVMSFLSEGICLPVFFDLSELNGIYSFQVFRYLGSHLNIKDVFQYKAFLINPSKLSFLFMIYNFYKSPIFPNKIFTNSYEATNYCCNKMFA